MVLLPPRADGLLVKTVQKQPLLCFEGEGEFRGRVVKKRMSWLCCVVCWVCSNPQAKKKNQIRRGASEERSSAEQLLSTNVSSEDCDEEQSVDCIKDKRTKEPGP